MAPADDVAEVPDAVGVALDHPADVAGLIELRHARRGPELDPRLERGRVRRRTVASHAGHVLDEGGVRAAARVHPDDGAVVVVDPVTGVRVLEPGHAGVGTGLVEEDLLHAGSADRRPVAPERGVRGRTPKGHCPSRTDGGRGVAADPDRAVVAGGGGAGHDVLGVRAPARDPGDARIHGAAHGPVPDGHRVEAGRGRLAGIEDVGGALPAPDHDVAARGQRRVGSRTAAVREVPDRDRAVGLTPRRPAGDLAGLVQVAPADDRAIRVVDVVRGHETTRVLVPAPGPGRPGHVRLEVDVPREVIGDLDGGPLDGTEPLPDPRHPLGRGVVVRGDGLQRAVVGRWVAHVRVRVDQIGVGVVDDVVRTDPGVARTGREGLAIESEDGETDRRHDEVTQDVTLFDHAMIEPNHSWRSRD